METSKILKCTCKHEQQDKMHGLQMRVHTKMAQKDSKDRRWKCTVCLQIRESHV